MKRPFQTLVLLTILLTSLIVLQGIPEVKVAEASGEGWLSGWKYRKSNVIQSASGAGTNYQMYIIVHYGSGTDSGADVYLNGKCRSDFGDIRITSSDGQTVIAGENNGWMEEKVDGDYAKIWFKVPDDLSTNDATIYVYYGKSDAAWNGNATDTFMYFEDFEGDVSD